MTFIKSLLESLIALPHHLIPIILGLSGIGFLIGFHELGHFLFCKLFHIYTPSFSIGFGPKLISRKIGTTEFSLSLLPLGGYVEIAGAAEVGQGDQKQAHSVNEDSFATKPFYQKLLVMLGGILFNILFAYIVVIGLFVYKPDSSLLAPLNVTPIIESLADESVAQRSGLQVGDQLHSAQGIFVGDDISTFLATIHKNPNTPIEIVVKRDGELAPLSITPESTTTESGSTIGTLGITGFKPVSSLTIVESIKRGIRLTNYYIKNTAYGLLSMITERNTKGLGGPLMIISLSTKKAAEGFAHFLILLALISISLAVMNLIPLPIFDGGQILFYSIEAAVGRPLSPTIREYIHIATWLVVLFLILCLTIRDAIHIVSPHLETIKQMLGRSA